MKVQLNLPSLETIRLDFLPPAGFPWSFPRLTPAFWIPDVPGAGTIETRWSSPDPDSSGGREHVLDLLERPSWPTQTSFAYTTQLEPRNVDTSRDH
jgi:hypothetical protein